MPEPIAEREVFAAAAVLPAAERPAYLDVACAGRPEARARVEQWLQTNDADSFMEAGPVPVRPGESGIETIVGVNPEEAGGQIGPYKLMEQIGQGGFGTVWVANQEKPVRRQVALKIIKMGMDTKEVIARFEQERQALAMMDHPHISKVLDAGTTQWGRPYFVMELVRGIRITDYCDKANLPTAQRLALFIQVCHAVQHAHQKGIIHRDLKPSNILVTAQDGAPVPKIIDFGIAKATAGRLADATVYTQLNHFIGTPAYMSPEQAEMTSLDMDTRSDLYSLGVLLYELLVGKTPFDQQTLLRAGLDEMRRVIREEEPPKPSTALQSMEADVRTTVARRRQADGAKLTGLLRGDLDLIVMKAMEKDRTRRYQTANGFAEDIRRYLANEPVTAAAPGVTYLFRKFARRNKAALAVAALVAVLLVAATAVSMWQAGLARKAAADALEARNDATAQAAAERVAREDAEAVTQLLTGMFQSPDPARDGRKITVAETLDAAAGKLENDPAIQPARKAQLRYTLGLTYHSLGLAAEAVPLLEAAWRYNRTALGPEHPRALMMMGDLGFSYAAAGRPGDALKLQEERVALCRRIYSLADPDMLAALGSLSNAWAAVGRYEEALKLCEEVLPLMRTVNGPAHRNTLVAMSNLAVSCAEAGREDEALRIREAVLTASRDANGPKHPDTLGMMHNLALSYEKTGREEEALALREQVIGLMLEVNGPRHTGTLTAMSNLAISHGRSGDLTKALEMNEEVLRLRKEADGPEHPETLMAMTQLAVSYGKGDRMPEAIEMQENALAAMRRVLPPKHPYLVAAMQIMSALYWEDGRRDEANQLRLEREALTPGMKPPPGGEPEPSTQPPAAPATTRAMAEEDVKRLEAALETSRVTNGPGSLKAIGAMTLLVGAYSADGNARKGIKLGEEALALARRELPAGDERIISLMELLIPLYKSVDLDTEAAKLEAEMKALTTEKQK